MLIDPLQAEQRRPRTTSSSRLVEAGISVAQQIAKVLVRPPADRGRPFVEHATVDCAIARIDMRIPSDHLNVAPAIRDRWAPRVPDTAVVRAHAAIDQIAAGDVETAE